MFLPYHLPPSPTVSNSTLGGTALVVGAGPVEVAVLRDFEGPLVRRSG